MVTFSDPLVSQQWHLRLLGDINTIWNEFSGAGIRVAVYDDGVQYDHPDLDGNYDDSAHFEFGGDTYDPYPIDPFEDGHGTSVAGIIAAEAGNGIGGVGVAWGATLTGMNFLADSRVWNDPDVEEAMFLHAANFDIMSNSWGYDPYFENFLNRGDSGSYGYAVEAGMAQIAATGRGGLGTIIVKAAGNEAANANGEGLNGSRFVISVGALTSTGQVTDYSNFGTNILVSAGAAAVTTDLTGVFGYNPASGTAGNYTTATGDSSFGGTSAATPVVSGVIALMLEANGDLGWRDVREIIATSAKLTGSVVTGVTTDEVMGTDFQASTGFGDSWNDGGRAYSNDYGFGRIDAFAAVRMAEAWALWADAPQTSANEDSFTATSVTTPPVGFPSEAVPMEIEVTEEMWIESIDVTVDYSFAISDHTTEVVELILVAPDGTEFELVQTNQLGLDLTEPLVIPAFSYWTYGVSHALGLNSEGTWQLFARGNMPDTIGLAAITGFSMNFYGREADNDNVHHITQDYLLAQSRNTDGTRDRVIDDNNGGEDWLNMAAIAGAVNVNLAPGGRILVGGAQWATIASGAYIENIVTGDGSDVINGSIWANELYGMRGNDTIHGLAGDDTMDGGAGNDSLRGDEGNDLINGLQGNDTLYGGLGIDTLYGGDGNDRMFGEGDNDLLYGGTGTDSASGGTGDDTIWAEQGNDTVLGDAGNDSIRGGDGNDSLSGGADSDTINGDSNNDSISGGDGNDLLFGGLDNDTVSGDAGNDVVDGGSGNDSLSGGTGDDELDGESGNDTMLGGDGNDLIEAGSGNDSLNGGAGNDEIEGDDGNDTLLGEAGNDALYGGADNDSLNGGGNDDILDGGTGNDTLLGDLGNDTLSGGIGNDSLNGGAGNDTLGGNEGNDTV
ncbi:MAG: S8 family serine peptidase, partial [Tabrizicola sp.]|nr:S8 family serine peptidase [Tabrizicola sp.]